MLISTFWLLANNCILEHFKIGIYFSPEPLVQTLSRNWHCFCNIYDKIIDMHAWTGENKYPEKLEDMLDVLWDTLYSSTLSHHLLKWWLLCILWTGENQIQSGNACLEDFSKCKVVEFQNVKNCEQMWLGLYAFLVALSTSFTARYL